MSSSLLPLAAGVVGAGGPLVLLHSFPLHRGVWREQAAAFAATQRVIMPDLRGFGESPAAAETTTMEDAADDVARLLDALGVAGPVTLAGLSMGGYVALAFAERHPERLGRLILCDTRAASDTPEKQADRRRAADAVLREGTAAFVAGVRAQQLSPVTLKRRPAVVAAVEEMAAAATAAGVAAALRGMAERPDRTALLPQLALPALLLCGEDDAITPPDEMRSLAAAMADATFVAVPAAGHLAPLENPEPVNAALRAFLNR